jgi:hypothetical protein
VTFASGSKVSSIGRAAVEECYLLHPICIPSSVETISSSCFHHCTKPAGVTFEPVFQGCENIANLNFESGRQICNLGRDAFGSCSSLESICIPYSVQVVSAYRFTCCRSLLRI